MVTGASGAPLRVFVAHHHRYPPAAGADIHVWAVVAGLAARGFHVITQGERGPDGVEMIPFGRRPTLDAVRRSDAVYVRIDGGLNRDKVTGFAWLARPRPAVVWEVNATLDEQIPQGLDAATLRRWRLTRGVLARGVDAALVVSDELVPYVRDELKIQDVTVIPNGATLEPDALASAASSPIAEADAFVALWMGSAEYPWMGFDTALEAARILDRRGDPSRVAIVGRVEDDVARTAPPNVMLLGKTDRPGAAAHLRAAGVALCLYHDTPWARGGFYMSPIKLFEAWSAGLPVIATDLSSIRKAVRDGENALLVPDDATAVADAIVRLREDAALRTRLSDGGRAAVRDFYNWDRVADQVAELLRRVVRERAARRRPR